MKFAVLDDSPFFLKALEREWNAIHDDHPDMEAVFVRVSAAQDFARQIAPLQDCGHLLLDVSALNAERMQLLADTLPNTHLWMMTGKALAEEVDRWLAWCQNHAAAQAQWFEKPLSLAETVLPVWLAAGAGVAAGHAEILAELERWPFPCRWFNAQCAAITSNRLWRIALDANPNHFSKDDLDGLQRGEAITLDTWSEHPEQPGRYGKVRYVTRAWQGGFVQFGLALPKTEGDGVKKAVSEIFDLMVGGGSFTRARYYDIVRVPGSAGLLCLHQASHPLDVELPVCQPLGPTLTKRVGEYDAEFTRISGMKKDRAELIRYIREHKTDRKSSNADIQYWRAHANTGNAPWLALPVCKKGERRAAALLIFDRLGKHGGADDYEGEKISPELVENLAPKLLGGLDHLREALWQEDRNRLLERRERMAKWRSIFAGKVDEKNTGNACLSALELVVLDAAKDLTKADSALLALRPPAANYLESRTYTQELMAGLHLDFRRSHFIAVRCAVENAPIYVPEYQRSMSGDDCITEADWRDALAHLPKEVQDERLPKLLRWQEKEIGSVVALPVSYDEHLLGVLVLRHGSSHFFTEEKVALAQTLIREAHPFLRRARALEARDAWDSMIFHEVRSGLGHIRQQADWVLCPSASFSPEEAARGILARTVLMADLSNEILAMLGYKDQRPELRQYDRTRPLDLFHGLWQELQCLPEADGKTLGASGVALHRPLHDPDNALPHVLRVLLENALRYGKPGVIQATPEAASDHWHLCLCNPGQFSEDILRGQFTGLSDREDLAQDSLRAHIGLASCRRVLERLNGRLDLKNRPAQEGGQVHACVTLIWPYAPFPTPPAVGDLS